MILRPLLFCVVLLSLGGCARAVDQVVAENGAKAFEAICLAPDVTEALAQAERLYFRRIEGDAAAQVLRGREGQVLGRRAIGTDLVILLDQPRRCELGIGAAAPAQVDAKLTEVFGRLALRGVSVIPLTRSGTADFPNRSARLSDPAGQGRIVALTSVPDPANLFRTTLLMTESPELLAASYRLKP